MRHLLLLFFVFLFFSCENHERYIPECNAQDPINELEWLGEVKDQLVDCSCQISVMEGEYRNKTVYFTLMNDPLCNSVFGVTLMDCQGHEIKAYDDFNTFSEEVEIEESLYMCN